MAWDDAKEQEYQALRAQLAARPTAPTGPKQNTSALGDFGTDIKRGIQKVPGAVTGLLDIPVAAVSGRAAVSEGWEGLGELTGFQPGKWADEAQKQYSPGRQAAMQEAQQATGVADTAKAYLTNPSMLVGTVLESLPSVALGGVYARGLNAARGLGATGLSGVVRGGIGEGAVMAGHAMESMIDEGADPRTAAGLASVVGVGGGALGVMGGRLAERMGLIDPDTLVAGGVQAAGAAARQPMGLARRVAGGAFTEGVFEEAPQTMLETVAGNVAVGREWDQDLAKNATVGALAGGLMGGVFNIPGARRPVDVTNDAPPAPPRSALEEATYTDTVPMQEWIDSQTGVARGSKHSRKDAEAAFGQKIAPTLILDADGKAKNTTSEFEFNEFMNDFEAREAKAAALRSGAPSNTGTPADPIVDAFANAQSVEEIRELYQNTDYEALYAALAGRPDLDERIKSVASEPAWNDYVAAMAEARAKASPAAPEADPFAELRTAAPKAFTKSGAMSKLAERAYAEYSEFSDNEIDLAIDKLSRGPASPWRIPMLEFIKASRVQENGNVQTSEVDAQSSTSPSVDAQGSESVAPVRGEQDAGGTPVTEVPEQRSSTRSPLGSNPVQPPTDLTGAQNGQAEPVRTPQGQEAPDAARQGQEAAFGQERDADAAQGQAQPVQEQPGAVEPETPTQVLERTLNTVASSNLPTVQKLVLDHIMNAVRNNTMDDVVDANGVLQVALIAKAVNKAPGSVKMAVNSVAKKIAAASGLPLDQVAAALRAPRVRTADLDGSVLGLSPQEQAGVMDDSEGFGDPDMEGQDGVMDERDLAGDEASFGSVSSIGGSQASTASGTSWTTLIKKGVPFRLSAWTTDSIAEAIASGTLTPEQLNAAVEAARDRAHLEIERNRAGGEAATPRASVGVDRSNENRASNEEARARRDSRINAAAEALAAKEAASRSVEERRVAEAQARREAAISATLSHPYAKEAAEDWDSSRTDAAPVFASLDRDSAFAWVQSFVGMKNGEVSAKELDAIQRELESEAGETQAADGRGEELAGEPVVPTVDEGRTESVDGPVDVEPGRPETAEGSTTPEQGSRQEPAAAKPRSTRKTGVAVRSWYGHSSQGVPQEVAERDDGVFFHREYGFSRAAGARSWTPWTRYTPSENAVREDGRFDWGFGSLAPTQPKSIRLPKAAAQETAQETQPAATPEAAPEVTPEPIAETNPLEARVAALREKGLTAGQQKTLDRLLASFAERKIDFERLTDEIATLEARVSALVEPAAPVETSTTVPAVSVARKVKRRVVKPEAETTGAVDSVTAGFGPVAVEEARPDFQLEPSPQGDTQATETVVDEGHLAPNDRQLELDLQPRAEPKRGATTLVEAMKSAKTAPELARWLAENAQDQSIRILMRKIVPLLSPSTTVHVAELGEQAPSRVVNNLLVGKGAHYHNWNTGESDIWFRGESFQTNGMTEETAAHELLHAATMTRLKFGNLRRNENTPVGKATVDLIGLRNHIVKHYNAQVKAGTELPAAVKFAVADVDELLAWGLTNPRVQEYLRSIPYKASSVWNEFVELLRKLLGLSGRESNALDALLDKATALLEADSLGPQQLGGKDAAMGTAEMRPQMYSKAEGRAGSTTDAVWAAVDSVVTRGGRNKITVVQSADELVERGVLSSDEARGAQGFVTADGRAYFIADNIPAGNELAVFLHEVGAHLGLERILTDAQYEQLVQAVFRWAKKNDGSVESRIARAAIARMESAKTADADLAPEAIAYFIEEAVKAGVNPTAMSHKGELARWFRTMWAAFKVALRKLNLVNVDRLSAQNVVDLAYGAARLETSSTFHGTAANFRRFDHRFMGSGEGAQAFGWGTYLAQRFGIANEYFEADVRRKGLQRLVEVGGAPLRERIKQLVKQNVAYVDKTRDYSGDKALRPELDALQALEGAVYRAYDLEGAVHDARLDLEDGGNSAALAWLDANLNSITSGGNIHITDINATEDEMLDWDRPLSEQPAVNELLLDGLTADLMDKANLRETDTGKEAYRRLERALGSDKAASEYLDSIGIKGIKFLDAVSRRNKNYKIVPDNGRFFALELLSSGATSSIIGDMNGYATEAEAKAAAEQWKGPQTRNLVVFNDKNIYRVGSRVGGPQAPIRFSRDFGTDPTPQGFFDTLKDKVSDLATNPKQGLQQHGLGWLTLEQLAERVKSAAVAKYNAVMVQIQKGAKDIVSDAAAIDVKWARLTDAQQKALSNVMRTATRLQFDPAKAAPANPEEVALKEAYDRLQPAASGVYTEVRDFYDGLFKQRKKILLDAAAKGVKGGKNRLEVERTFAGLKGPYFPLKRLGNWYSVGMSPELKALIDSAEAGTASKADLKRIELLKKSDKHYITRGHQTAAEAKRAAKALEADLGVAYFNTAKVHIGAEMASIPDIEKINSYLAADLPKEVRGQVRDMLSQMYFDMLESHSALKSQMKRKNYFGEEEDMRRVFSSTATAQAHHISRLRYSNDLAESMVAVQKEGSHGNILMRNVYNELVQRTKLALERNENPFVDRILQFSYFTHLGLSPAFWLTNMSQVITTTLPWLSARHGVSTTGRAMASAYGDVVKMLGDTYRGKGWKDGWRSEFDWSQRFADGTGESRLFRDLLDRNLLDITMEHDLTAVAEMRYNRKIDDAIKIANMPVRVTEIANRAVTGLAAYRMKMASLAGNTSMTQEQKINTAIEHAAKAVSETQLNYSSLNTARHMQSVMGSKSGARLIMQFRKYQQGMLYLIGASFNDAFRGKGETDAETKRIKREARRTLIGMFATTGMLAGAVGMPLVGTVAAVINAVANARGDDDEPYNLEVELRNYFHDLYGKEVSDAIMLGLPTLINTDLSRRVGLGTIADPLPFARSKRTVDDTAGSYLFAASGPAMDMTANMFDGMIQMAGGDVAKGLEKVIPVKAVANSIRAYRFNDEGMTDRNGNIIQPAEKFDAWDLTLRAMGFQSMKESDYYSGNEAIQTAKTAVTDKRNALIRNYANAVVKGEDVTEARAEIAAFNQRNPTKGLRIERSGMLRAVQARRKMTTERNDVGIRVGKAEAPFADRARFASP